MNRVIIYFEKNNKRLTTYYDFDDNLLNKYKIDFENLVTDINKFILQAKSQYINDKEKYNHINIENIEEVILQSDDGFERFSKYDILNSFRNKKLEKINKKIWIK